MTTFHDLAVDARGAPASGSPTRAQADAVLSLWTSARAQGLRVVLIDAGTTVRGRLTPVAELQDCVAAWGLGAFPLVGDDPGSGLARRYGVRRIPAVFLLDGAAIVPGRWDEVVSVATLASELESLR